MQELDKMPTKIDLTLSSEVSGSVRARQLEGLFDIPRAERVSVTLQGDFPYNVEPWNIGLIVGPSGSGKTQIKRSLWGEEKEFTWEGKSVIDDFPKELTANEISSICQAVGFNTIPAWLRPYHVLSNGEQFRVSMARNLVSDANPIVVDEFTSVVDRQVAQIASHAVQKLVRKMDKKLVALSCHYDIIDWLQPDWIFEPASWAFTRRSLQPRPPLSIEISAVNKTAWRMFRPFHYMTSTLHNGAACYVLFVNGRPASFAATLNRPHQVIKNLIGFTRNVTLPDWQGLGLMFVLVNFIASCYKTKGFVVHNYPAHPAYVRGHDRSPLWQLRQKPGTLSNSSHYKRKKMTAAFAFGGRPNAVFRYVGPAASKEDATLLFNGLARIRRG